MLFEFSRGNWGESDDDFGLYAGWDNGKYAISSMLWENVEPQDINLLSLEFKAVKESGQVCGDTQVSLFGDKNHLSE